MVDAVAERLVGDKVWLACISDEVGERMMSGPLRQRLSWMLTTMLASRAQVHGEALAVLSGALQELKQDWRTTQGGENGGPTATQTLLTMVEKASKMVKESEEAVQRTIKLALEEQRAESQWADSAGPTLYKGDAEKLNMPAGVNAGDREIMRNLVSMIGKHAERANTLTVEGGPPTPTPQGTREGVPPSAMANPGTSAMELDRTSAMAGEETSAMTNPGTSAMTDRTTAGSLTDPTRGEGPGDGPGGRDDDGGINDSIGGTTLPAGTPRGTANNYGDPAASPPSRSSSNNSGDLAAFDLPVSSLATEPASSVEPSPPPSTQCAALTKSGSQCSRQGGEEGFCKQHTPATPAKRKRKKR